MSIEYFNINDKPSDWPANAIECQLENIHTQLMRFKEEPTYKNKEVLISLVSDYDLNQRSALGLLRTTEYEVVMINSLFLQALYHNINALKAYLYELVGTKARMQKMASWFPEGTLSLQIEEYMNLILQLKVYYVSYLNFTVDKDKPYIDKLIDVIEEYIDYLHTDEDEASRKAGIATIENAYISLLNDISYFRCVKRTGIWALDRKEILKAFNLAARLVKLNGNDPTTSPLKGVLMTSISNYILKSRNNYNKDYICKYVSTDVAEKSIENQEIWMSSIKNLNDEREQRVVPEFFDEDGWSNFSWVKDLNLEPTRTYYISSFCKTLNDTSMMRDYGSCIYGYKDDRMADILAPTNFYKYSSDGDKVPVLSQVVAFDVIYDQDEAKEEINFLCSVIDCFNMCDEDKKHFLEEILQYWILSVKDKDWSHERERRYVLFMYDDYDYTEIDITDSRFLKMKTSLFLHPDFVLGENPVMFNLRTFVDDKRHAISMKPYIFCRDCLNRDFDAITGVNQNTTSCSICNSSNVSHEMPRTN